MGRNSQGIIELVPVLAKGFKYDFGYTPTDDNVKTKKKKDQELAKPIPHLYQSFPIREYAEPEDCGKGIRDLFKEINAIIEEEVEPAVIHNAEPGEMLQNWTSTPVLIS